MNIYEILNGPAAIPIAFIVAIIFYFPLKWYGNWMETMLDNKPFMIAWFIIHALVMFTIVFSFMR